MKLILIGRGSGRLRVSEDEDGTYPIRKSELHYPTLIDRTAFRWVATTLTARDETRAMQTCVLSMAIFLCSWVNRRKI